MALSQFINAVAKIVRNWAPKLMSVYTEELQACCQFSEDLRLGHTDIAKPRDDLGRTVGFLKENDGNCRHPEVGALRPFAVQLSIA